MILQIKDANGNWVGIPAIQGTPGESGGGRSIILSKYTNTMTDEMKAFVEEMWQYYQTNNTVMPADIYIEMDGGTKAAVSSIYFDIRYNKLRMYIDTAQCYGDIVYMFDSNGVYSSVGEATNSKDDDSGNDWNTTSDIGDSGLYAATEVYMRLQNTNNNLYGFSYLVVPNGDTLGNYCYQDVVITTTDGLDNMVAHWYYNGSYIIVNYIDSEYYVDYIAYK